ncbi:MAG: hypothetical protein MI924_35255 [Chloroflexales bacterium]|nr:hypothetical protein [Chloroflexales bacterium]
MLSSVRSGASFEAIAATLRQRQQHDVTHAEVEAAYQHVITRIEQIEAQEQNVTQGFLMKVRFIPARVVPLIAQRLAVGSHPVLFLSLVTLIIVGSVASLTQHGLALYFSQGGFWLGYGLFVASLLMHEFGQASACARYGVRPGDIGFAIYWVFPVFYSDDTAAWQLKRWQRVIVDIGGVFFQLVVGVSFVFAYLITGWEPLQIAWTMILANCLFALNPILRFDATGSLPTRSA